MVAALDLLEISFLAFVGAMTAAAGIFGLYLLVQLFRNPGVRRRRRST